MWKLVFIVLVALAIWKFYPSFTNVNIKDVQNSAINAVKSEKTISAVAESKMQSDKELQSTLDNQ